MAFFFDMELVENYRRIFMRKLFLFLMLFLGGISFCYANSADDILGQWATEQEKSHVEITLDQGKYFGRIVWLKDPVYATNDAMAGQIVMDRKNPDVAKRKIPLVGKEILSGFRYDSHSQKWVDGKIYNPEDGNTYFCSLTLDKSGKLLVRGSIDMFGLLSKTTYWEKVNK